MRGIGLTLLTVLAGLPLLGGCTIVRVEGASPATSVHFGVLRLAPATPDSMISVDATGIGLVPGMSGATLGFARSRMVFLNDLSRCRLVIFETGNDPQSRAFWAEAISDVQQACNQGEMKDGG